jgi:hypothetical protein
MGKLGVDLEIVFKLKFKQVSKKKNSHKLIFLNEKKKSERFRPFRQLLYVWAPLHTTDNPYESQ